MYSCSIIFSVSFHLWLAKNIGLLFIFLIQFENCLFAQEVSILDHLMLSICTIYFVHEMI